MIFGRRKVVIIGAGLAGLSLATELVDEGFDVEIFERNRYLGGRASDLVDHKTHDPVPIGPHVFAASYNNFFRFLRKINAHRLIDWERNVFIEVIYKGEHHKLRFYALPAPFFMLPWIAAYPFIRLRDKLSNIVMSVDIWFSPTSRLRRLDAMTALEYLRSRGVSKPCIDRFWRFIVISLLNVPLEKCSAAEFTLLVKHWAHLKRRKFGFPKVGLGDIYADEAEKYIRAHGGTINRNCFVKEVRTDGTRIKSIVVERDGVDSSVTADVYVSTLHPIQLRELLPEDQLSCAPFNVLLEFEPVPYMSVNIWFDKKVTTKKFWAMVSGDPEGPAYLNTDFYDLSNIYTDRTDAGSYIASNIIYSGSHHILNDDEVIRRTLEEIAEVFPHNTAKPVHAHVHRTPYVIYAPLPGSIARKLSHKTPISNFFLAGDWTARVPQCMEAAVRSGYKCAEEILQVYGMQKRICDDRVY